jgi:hypothetical protein
VHRVALELRKERQGQRVKARLLTKGPTAQSVAADFCNKIGAMRPFVVWDELATEDLVRPVDVTFATRPTQAIEVVELETVS